MSKPEINPPTALPTTAGTKWAPAAVLDDLAVI
jgi:hypothetical protein